MYMLRHKTAIDEKLICNHELSKSINKPSVYKIGHNSYITFLKTNWHSPVVFFFSESLTEELALAILCLLPIDTSKLGINSSCLSIECGNDSKLYGDFDCNAYLKTRCTNNSIGKIIYLVHFIVFNYLKYVNSFQNIKKYSNDFSYKNVIHKTSGNSILNSAKK